MTVAELIEKLQVMDRDADIRVLFNLFDWKAEAAASYIEIDKMILIRIKKRGYPKPGPKPESSL